jgi:hypothetical protein
MAKSLSMWSLSVPICAPLKRFYPMVEVEPVSPASAGKKTILEVSRVSVIASDWSYIRPP